MSNTLLGDATLEETTEQIEPIKPLFTVEKGEPTSKWLKNTFAYLMRRNRPDNEETSENLKLYKGQVFEKQKSAANSRLTSEAQDPLLEKARNAKLYDNLIYDSVEFLVTTHNADRPGLDIGPANVEYEDRIGATMAKAVIDSINYINNEDKVERDALRLNFIAGEHYVATLWDSSKGDLNPDYLAVKAATEGDTIELPNPENPEKPFKWPKNKPVRNGDVVYKHFPKWKVLLEPTESFEKVEWLITWDAEYVECIKKEYPKKRELIKGLTDSEQIEGFDPEYVRKMRQMGKVLVLTLWAKGTQYMPEGRYVKALTDGTILEDGPHPYEDLELPFVRLTDMDVPGELRGKSGLRNIKGLQYQQFFLTSMAAANLRLMGYPKWWMEAGSINIKDLANTRSVIQGRPGSMKPEIIQPNPTSPEVYKQIADIGMRIDAKVKGPFANPSSLPARIDSALALQFLSEKDLKRQHTMVSKVNEFRVGLAQMAIRRAAQFYRVDDKRVLNIVGKNHEHDLKFFNFQNFNRPYVIRVKAGSALPEQKSAKLEYISKIVEQMPGLLTNSQVVDILDLGSVDKLVDVTTKALRAAESIIQDLLTGNPVPPPEGFEDLITYWNTFSTYIQDRQFKESVPAQNKQNVLEYLMGIEALMLDKSMKNPAFAQQLMTLTLYPLVFTLPPAPEAPPAPTAPQGEEVAEGEQVLSPEEQMAQDQQVSGEIVNASSDMMRSSVEGGDHENQ